MTRKLKILGPTLVAALALSALAAQTAPAVTHSFNAGSNPAHLTGEAVSGEAGYQVVETTTGAHASIICQEITFANMTLSNPPVSELTGEPIYSKCSWWKTKPEGTTTETSETEEISGAFFVTAGCHLRFYNETTEGNPTGGEHANIETANQSNCSHLETLVTALKFRCFAVPTEQLWKHAVRYKNRATSPEMLEVDITAHGIESTTIDSMACPTKSGEDEVHTNTSYDGTLVLSAFSDEAHTEPTDIEIE